MICYEYMPVTDTHQGCFSYPFIKQRWSRKLNDQLQLDPEIKKVYFEVKSLLQDRAFSWELCSLPLSTSTFSLGPASGRPGWNPFRSFNDSIRLHVGEKPRLNPKTTHISE